MLQQLIKQYAERYDRYGPPCAAPDYCKLIRALLFRFPVFLRVLPRLSIGLSVRFGLMGLFFHSLSSRRNNIEFNFGQPPLQPHHKRFLTIRAARRAQHDYVRILILCKVHQRVLNILAAD